MMTNRLTHFAIEPDGECYSLQLTMEDGTTIAVGVTFDQLDLLGEEIDRRLDADQDLLPPEL
jgi:hypothetical protein